MQKRIDEEPEQEQDQIQEQTLDTGKTGYEREKEEQEKRSDYLKFPEGDTIVIPQKELYDIPVTETDFKDGKPPRQVKELPVMLEDGTVKPLSLPLGGKKSMFGKFLNIGLAQGNLVGRKIRVTRQGTSKEDTTYTIIEVK